MKTTKKLAVILVVALMLATMIAFVACDPKTDPNAFTVVVLLPDGTPAVDCGVQLCEIKPETGVEDLCHSFYTDAKGTVVMSKEDTITGCTVCNLHFPEGAMLAGYKVPEASAHLQVQLGKTVTVRLEAVEEA